MGLVCILIALVIDFVDLANKTTYLYRTLSFTSRNGKEHKQKKKIEIENRIIVGVANNNKNQ